MRLSNEDRHKDFFFLDGARLRGRHLGVRGGAAKNPPGTLLGGAACSPIGAGVRADAGIRGRGRWAFAARVEESPSLSGSPCSRPRSGIGLVRIGWSCRGSTLELGEDATGLGYESSGAKCFGGELQSFGECFAGGDWVTALLDLDRQAVLFQRNGSLVGCGFAFRIPPSLHGETFFPHVFARNATLRVAFVGGSSSAIGESALYADAGSGGTPPAPPPGYRWVGSAAGELVQPSANELYSKCCPSPLSGWCGTAPQPPFFYGGLASPTASTGTGPASPPYRSFGLSADSVESAGTPHPIGAWLQEEAEAEEFGCDEPAMPQARAETSPTSSLRHLRFNEHVEVICVPGFEWQIAEEFLPEAEATRWLLSRTYSWTSSRPALLQATRLLLTRVYVELQGN